MDRTYIGLPRCQVELLEKIVSAATGTVIVLLSNGGPLSSDTLAMFASGSKPAVHGVLETFELGPYTGQVIAEVLWGQTNPSGMLPFTVFPEGEFDPPPPVRRCELKPLPAPSIHPPPPTPTPPHS